MSSKSSNFPPKWYSLQKQILDGRQELMGRTHSPLRGADTMLNTIIVKTITMGSRVVVRTEKGDRSLSDSTNIVGQKQSSRTLHEFEPLRRAWSSLIFQKRGVESTQERRRRHNFLQPAMSSIQSTQDTIHHPSSVDLSMRVKKGSSQV